MTAGYRWTTTITISTALLRKEAKAKVKTTIVKTTIVKITIVKTTIVTIVTIVNIPTVLTMPPSAVCVGTW